MAAIIVAIIVIALVVHGCEVSQTNSSLKNYAASVDTLMSSSGNNGATLFKDLQSGALGTSGGEQTLQNELNSVLDNARSQAHRARSLSAPGQLRGAQSALVQVMTLREQGISSIAHNIGAAANTGTSANAISQIVQAMYRLSGSDVTYKTFVAPKLAAALNHAGVPVGGTTGAQIYAGQILGDLGWLNPTTVGKWIKANLPASVLNQVVPGKAQGHELTSVTVGGTTLNQVGTNTIAAKPAPAFTLNFSNSGQTPEYRVKCIVKVDALGDQGTAVVAKTVPGQAYTCTVKLPSSPPASFYKVTAEVKPVPGEENKLNNVQTFEVDFN